jgi:hypothetical protein
MNNNFTQRPKLTNRNNAEAENLTTVSGAKKSAVISQTSEQIFLKSHRFKVNSTNQRKSNKFANLTSVCKQS